MTTREALCNSVSFSVGARQAEVIAVTRELDLDGYFSSEVARSREFLLCKADLIRLAVSHPNVSEGGVSISFSDRSFLVSEANRIYARFNEPKIADSHPTVEPLE